MRWTAGINDLQKKSDDNKHRLLAVIENEDYFYASAVFNIDFSNSKEGFDIEVPLTPILWTSFVQNCAGHDLIFSGGENVYHSYQNGVLRVHPVSLPGWRSKRLWRESSDCCYFAGGDNRIVGIHSDKEVFDDIHDSGIDLTCINGLHPDFRIAGGRDGILYINRGQKWQKVDDVPTLSNFINIYCISEREIYLCAGKGGVFRWNGDSDWFHYETDADAFMYNVCQYKDRICAASLSSKSYWLEDNGAVPMPDSKLATEFRSDGELLFGLGAGKVDVFDGTNWRMYELDLYKLFPKELEAMYAVAPK